MKTSRLLSYFFPFLCSVLLVAWISMTKDILANLFPTVSILTLGVVLGLCSFVYNEKDNSESSLGSFLQKAGSFECSNWLLIFMSGLFSYSISMELIRVVVLFDSPENTSAQWLIINSLTLISYLVFTKKHFSENAVYGLKRRLIPVVIGVGFGILVSCVGIYHK